MSTSRRRKCWLILASFTPCCATLVQRKLPRQRPGSTGTRRIYRCRGRCKIASATRADYAAAAARVISEAGHEGKVYELAGDSAWTLTQLAAELTKQSGKSVTYQNLSEADFAAALKSVGLPDGLADILADSDVGASKGGLFDNSKTLSKLIGRPTTTLAESVSHLFNVNN